MSTLTSTQRDALPSSAFVFPGQRTYPIHDEAHARDALACVAQNGTPEERTKVRAAVRKRYPAISQSGPGGMRANESPTPRRQM